MSPSFARANEGRLSEDDAMSLDHTISRIAPPLAIVVALLATMMTIAGYIQ